MSEGLAVAACVDIAAAFGVFGGCMGSFWRSSGEDLDTVPSCVRVWDERTRHYMNKPVSFRYIYEGIRLVYI
jgi:hypothetical protein